jgi:hypothetical protein
MIFGACFFGAVNLKRRTRRFRILVLRCLLPAAFSHFGVSQV